MMTPSPEQEANGERVFLITIRTEYGTSTLDSYVIRRAVANTYNEEGQLRKYNDGRDAKGLRNASWSGQKKTSLFIEDFAVSAYFKREDDTGKTDPYGVHHCFRNVHNLELPDAKAILNTLTKVGASLDKQAQEYGWPNSNDYAAHLLRVAKALGITTFLTYKNGIQSGSYDAAEFREHSAQYLSDVIANLIDKEVKK